MLPTRLNLLPPEKKTHLQQMIRNEFFKGSLQALTVLVSFIGIALLGGRYVLQNYFSDLGDNIVAINVRVEEKNTKIIQINETIATASAVFAKHVYWPDILSELHAVIPDDIIISQTRIDKTGGVGLIAGHAATRESLLAYGEALRTVSYIASANVPLEQLTKKEDISFSIQIILE